MLLMAMLCLASANTFAQTLAEKEVRGIETRITKEDNYKWGFEFYNANDFAVSVDAEIMLNFTFSNVGFTTAAVATKSFILEPSETYIWIPAAVRDRKDFADFPLYNSLSEETTYYAQYKAYKLK